MRFIWIISTFFALYLAAFSAFILTHNQYELAHTAAAIGTEEDCDQGGSLLVSQLSMLAQVYFKLPRVSESYLESGGSFIFPAITVMVCHPNEVGYIANTRRVEFMINHALSHGESINQLSANGFTPAHGAILINQLGLLKFLVDQGADLSIKSMLYATSAAREYPDMTPLELARYLKRNDWEVDEELLAYLELANLEL